MLHFPRELCSDAVEYYFMIIILYLSSFFPGNVSQDECLEAIVYRMGEDKGGKTGRGSPGGARDLQEYFGTSET